MVSVGALAAIINLTSLFVLAFSERLVAQILRRFSSSRSVNRIVTLDISDKDSSLLNIPLSLVKFRYFPGKFAIFPTIFRI